MKPGASSKIQIKNDTVLEITNISQETNILCRQVKGQGDSGSILSQEEHHEPRFHLQQSHHAQVCVHRYSSFFRLSAVTLGCIPQQCSGTLVYTGHYLAKDVSLHFCNSLTHHILYLHSPEDVQMAMTEALNKDAERRLHESFQLWYHCW
jgi:hypothetical protein